MVYTLKTPNARQYNYFEFRNGVTMFDVKAAHDAHIVFSGDENEANPVIEVIIGGWGNTKSVIRFNHTKPEVAEAQTPNILDANQNRRFLIYVSPEGEVSVEEEGREPFLKWRNPYPFKVNYFGVCSCWGSTAEWSIDDRPQQPGYPAPDVRRIWWQRMSNGQIPQEAVKGGEDGNDDLFVGRSYHENDLIPGKVQPSHGGAYVGFGGKEYLKTDYEVLCGNHFRWVPTHGKNLPERALPAGETSGRDTHGYPETLYIGRVQHNGTWTIGKVHPSHGVCYIPYNKEEMSFDSYQILEVY